MFSTKIITIPVETTIEEPNENKYTFYLTDANQPYKLLILTETLETR